LLSAAGADFGIKDQFVEVGVGAHVIEAVADDRLSFLLNAQEGVVDNFLGNEFGWL